MGNVIICGYNCGLIIQALAGPMSYPGKIKSLESDYLKRLRF